MKKIAFCVLGLSMALSSLALAGEQQRPEHFRMDCRFYGERDHSCVASASYEVTDGKWLSDIRYGVSCDRQTIYNNGATYMPQEQVADQLRPITAAIPRVELAPQGALLHAGTYTAKLELADKMLTNGVCYVSQERPSHHEDEPCDHAGSRDNCNDDHSGYGGLNQN